MNEPTRGRGSIRVVKGRDRNFTRGTQNVVSTGTDYARIRDEELRRRFAKLRRAYLAFEELMTEDGGTLTTETGEALISE